jgi:hypothetical protein
MITFFSIASSLLLCFFVFFLIYKGKLKEQYAILWLILSFTVLFFSIFTNLLDSLAGVLGVDYVPSLLFLFAFLIMFLILIQMSVVMSGLKDNIRDLTQEIGVLKNKKGKEVE